MLAADKIVHIKGGLLVLAFALVASVVTVLLGVDPVGVAVAISSVCAGLAVEGAQAADNRNAVRAGLPKPHEISWVDALASAAPGVLLAVALEVAIRRFGFVPPWG